MTAATSLSLLPSARKGRPLLSAFCAVLVVASILLPARSSAYELALEQRKSGALYVSGTGERGESSLSFLLDTGSNFVTVTGRTFRTLKAAGRVEYLRDVRGRLANGQSHRVPIYRLDELALAPDCRLQGVEIAVFERADQNILGLSALRDMGPFTVSLAPPSLRGEHCGAQQPKPLPAAASTVALPVLKGSH